MLNQVLDELDKPDAAESCQKRNSTHDRRAHCQHYGESRQPAPAISPKVTFAKPEIVINDHGCLLRARLAT
jgi:hypothetical protein